MPSLPEPTGRSNPVLTLEDQREFMTLVAEAATLPEGVTVSETYAGGCRAYWNDPQACAMDRVVLYFHGGGYLLGSPKTHERLSGHIANAVGCRVLSHGAARKRRGRGKRRDQLDEAATRKRVRETRRVTHM